MSASSRSFVADIAWIRRGVPKSVPEKIEVDKEDLTEILKGEEAFDEDESAHEEAIAENNESAVVEGLQKYNLDDYDEETDAPREPTMKGLAYYSSPLEDPYITRHADSDEEEEREDFEVKDTDNYVVVAKIVKDEPTLEVYIFNEENDDWYLHHDYILDLPPLCLAPFNYDPGSDNKKGNLIAVGTMDSVINIWDLDIVNAMEPVLCLGESSLKVSKKKKKSKGKATEQSDSNPSTSRKKRDGSAQYHTEAVLCLDWNVLVEHVLASGSADKTLILWDLDEAKPATVVNNFNGMIQSIQWHPVEQSVILSGTTAGRVSVTDCRSSETQSSPILWDIGEEHEIEKVIWNRFNPFCAFVCSSDGMLRYVDTRKPGEFVSEVLAHSDGTNDVSGSYKVKGLLTTAGSKEVKVWKLESDDKFRHISTVPLNMGVVNSAKFCPDAGNVVVVGAECEDLALLVYFSAGWCGSCRQFTPKLKDFYEQTKDNGLEVVWVSRDKTAEDQMEYYNQNLPPWLYIEYGKGIRDFLKVYEIKTIPAIKLVDVDGNIIDDGARAKIESPSGNPSKTLEEWKKMLKI
ncbi:thioredoxin-like domain-containing protein [Ditylenchus destructor]|nr:thioredoxin-like domain-containing protein [Ditylenchus destructor]